MNSEFRQKWIQRINSSSDAKCRLFLARLKEQDINIPFTKKQKFLYALLKTRINYLAQVNNPNKNITVLPRADKNDLNWTSPRSINNRQVQEYLLTKEKRGDTTK
mgnify:CR=1 FL=1|tara:strand:+ start:364 stop:678 length:315 start_codon:yes stop_codon:yes gene_type:complete